MTEFGTESDVQGQTADEKWIEKQNVFNDRLLCDCICYAAGSSELDPDVLIDLAACQVIKEMQDTEQDIYSLLSGTDKYTEAVKEMLGVSSADELTLRSHNLRLCLIFRIAFSKSKDDMAVELGCEVIEGLR